MARQTTKVKQILLRFDMRISFSDEEYTVTLIDKKDNEAHQWTNIKLPFCIQHAWYHFNRVTGDGHTGRSKKYKSFRDLKMELSE